MELFHLLIAVEDSTLRQKLIDAVTAAGFRFEECGKSAAADAVRGAQFDLVLLDTGLPAASGIELCRKLRALAPDMGIVVVRQGGTPSDDVRALDAGADDCIAAPFRFRELVARLGAVLRRVPVHSGPEATVLRAGELELDTVQRRCLRGGVEVHLSPLEFDLLVFLMKHPETTITHTRLLRGVWRREFDYVPGYLRSYIKALRGKIERNPSQPEYILTERWVGYRFHDPSESLRLPL